MAYDARPGDYRVICDHSGFKCWASETVIQWNGLRVRRDFADIRNPQDFLKAVPEGKPPSNTRPDTDPVYLWTAPSALTPPVISGDPTVGQALTATDGTWVGNGLVYSRQWLASNIAIPGATANVHVLTPAQAGLLVTFRVNVLNAAGNATAVSAAVGPVAALIPAGTGQMLGLLLILTKAA